MNIRIVILGSGTSTGVPMITCNCATCQSDDQHDKRLRASVLLQWPGCSAVIDATPDFRQQMLHNQVRRLDALLLTHNHADHVHGLDDLRQYTLGTDKRIPVYGMPETLQWVRRHFSYIWESTQVGGGLPQIDLQPVTAPFKLGNCEIVPIPAWHGTMPVYGYRIGDFAYITDVSAIPDSSLPLLSGIRTLVLDAVRYRPHATHLHVDAAVQLAQRLNVEQTWLTHICHHIRHRELAASLPPGIAPAYDNLELTASVAAPSA